MGELFRLESAEQPEPFTGERLTAAVRGQVQIEHYHRYLFARSMVAGLDVLDVASGEGYGSALLAQVARSVIGVEYSGSTAGVAAANFPRPNLRFLQGDARALPISDASIDIVVSFETIEHFDRQADFLREVRRVLRPDGLFIVSTPDRDVYSPVTSPANPYHVHELTRLEFVAMLQASFRHVQLMQQRAVIGSALLGETGSPAPPVVFDRRGETHFEACTGLPRAPFLVAVASDREPKPLPPSLYIYRSDVDTDVVRLAKANEQLRQTKAELEQTAVNLKQITGHLENTRERLAMSEAARVEAEQRAEAMRLQYEEVRGSARTFLRGYLPMLCAHILRQRP